MADLLFRRPLHFVGIAAVSLCVDSTAVAQQPAEEPAGDDPGAEVAQEEDAADFTLRFSGSFELDGNALSPIALHPLPRDESGASRALGRERWLEQRVRTSFDLTAGESIEGRLALDLADGVSVGDEAIGVGAAEGSRDELGARLVDLRDAHVTWTTPIGRLRAGLVPSHWGLGVLANDGERDTAFGRPRFGDRSIRLGFGTKPFGAASPFAIAIAGDLVYRDVTASLLDGDEAWQGVIAALYERGTRRAGLYGVVRSQRNDLDDALDLFVADAFFEWTAADPSAGEVFAAAEVAYVFGTTSFARTTQREEHDVEQFLAVLQLGRRHDFVDLVVEAGYASGDSNGEDSTQRRATLDPDHRVGLVLFPELLAAQTARAATLAGAPELFGRPARGSDLLPTNGGVAGAMYLNPRVTLRPTGWCEVRLGAIVARASADVVDPYVQRAQSRSVNFRGGDSRARDLGFELDASILLRHEISDGVTLSAKAEGGVLFPGHAFDDAAGQSMDEVGLARVATTLNW